MSYDGSDGERAMTAGSWEGTSPVDSCDCTSWVDPLTRFDKCLSLRRRGNASASRRSGVRIWSTLCSRELFQTSPSNLVISSPLYLSTHDANNDNLHLRRRRKTSASPRTGLQICTVCVRVRCSRPHRTIQWSFNFDLPNVNLPQHSSIHPSPPPTRTSRKKTPHGPLHQPIEL